MKVSLIAAGGLLAAAVAVAGLASPAGAEDKKRDCELSVADRTNTLGIDRWGVYAGGRDALACKHNERKHRYDTSYQEADDYDDADYDNGYDDADAYDGPVYGPGYANGYANGGYRMPSRWLGR